MNKLLVFILLAILIIQGCIHGKSFLETASKDKFEFKTCYNFSLENMESRKFVSLKDTLIGNWWSFEENDGYNESLYMEDSVYYYTYYMDRVGPINYKLSNRKLILNQFDFDTIILSIDVININTIHLFGIDTTFFKNSQMRIDTFDLVINRIPDSEFTFSDINCWGGRENRYGRIIYNNQTRRFKKEFYKRAYSKYVTTHYNSK
jgi:hypothetical protein